MHRHTLVYAQPPGSGRRKLHSDMWGQTGALRLSGTNKLHTCTGTKFWSHAGANTLLPMHTPLESRSVSTETHNTDTGISTPASTHHIPMPSPPGTSSKGLGWLPPSLVGSGRISLCLLLYQARADLL